jgi:hypothetical protein
VPLARLRCSCFSLAINFAGFGMSWGTINSIALLANLLGVVLLFRFGIPFRVKRKAGYSTIMIPNSVGDAEEARVNRRYERFGWLGLSLIASATALQIWVSIATL